MPFVRLWRALVLSFLAVALFTSGAFAQAVGNTDNALVDGQRAAIQKYSAEADALEKQVAANGDQDGKLVEIRLKLEELASELLSSAVAFRPRLSEINARL